MSRGARNNRRMKHGMAGRDNWSRQRGKIGESGFVAAKKPTICQMSCDETIVGGIIDEGIHVMKPFCMHIIVE